MNVKRSWFPILALALFAAAFAGAESGPNSKAPEPAPEEKTGIKIGEMAPDFKLKDQRGTERTLKAELAKGPVALVFYRSSRWCPFCKKQLIQIQKDLARIEAAGVRVLAISYDPVADLKKFSDKEKITYALLSDEGSRTIDAYGIRNTEVKAGSPQDGIPHPGTYLLDKQGIVRAKFFNEGYTVRHTNDELIRAAEKLK